MTALAAAALRPVELEALRADPALAGSAEASAKLRPGFALRLGLAR